MEAQFASGRLSELQRPKLLQELERDLEQIVEIHEATAEESFMMTAQEAEAARTEQLVEQEKQRIAQLEEQLKEQMEEIQVLRQKKRRLREEREELEVEGSWQQHQMELEAAHEPGTVLPELVEAQLEKEERARRRGLVFWTQTICVVFVSLQLLLATVLGCAVLYAQHYDQELLYRLLLLVLPRATYVFLAYFASKTLPVICNRLLPI